MSPPDGTKPHEAARGGVLMSVAGAARLALGARRAAVVLLGDDGRAWVAGADPGGAADAAAELDAARRVIAPGGRLLVEPGLLAARLDGLDRAPEAPPAGALVWRDATVEWPPGRLRDTVLALASHAGHAVAEARRHVAALAMARQHQLVLTAAGEGIVGLDRDGRVSFINPAGARMIRRRAETVIGREMHSLVHHSRADGSPYPREECPIQAAVRDGRVHTERSEVFWRGEGTSFRVEYSSTPVRDGNELVGAVVIFRDITERVRAERTLRDAEAENRRLADEQAVLRRVATTVAVEDDPARVLDLVAAEAARLLRVEAGLITRFEAHEAAALSWWEAGQRAERPTFSIDGAGALAQVHRTARPARIESYAGLGDDPTARMARAHAYRSSVAAPVQVGGRLWGAVLASTTRAEPIPEHAETRLAEFAELVGVTIANADDRARLAAQAAGDALTGLANHRAFHERLRAEVARAQRHDRRLALVLLDLDHFKLVNDAYGHQVGDRVLAEVGRRLSGVARTDELVARVGGEEFGWILPEADGASAYAAAERARAAIADAAFDPVGRLTVSAGVCDLPQAPSADALFRLADGALYWAKVHGRNVTYRYSPEVVEVLSAEERSEQLERERVLASLRALARAIDAKDSSTQSHSERVAAMAERLALASGWPPQRAAQLREAGLVHDVGKIGVPDAVLLKPGRLTDEEYELVKEHAERGATIVGEVLTDEQVAWVRHHHERWDGAGYPKGLRGEQIPVGARILAVADAWDVMVSERAYRATRTPAEALGECERCAGRHFCPEVVEMMRRLEDDPLPGANAGAAGAHGDDLLVRRG